MATAATATDDVVTAPASWDEFYQRNKSDGGDIEELFNGKMAEMTSKAVEHLRDPGRLTDSIVGSNYANMILVPGRPGKVHILHHGFGTNTSEGFHLVFLQGNLSDSVSFKMLPRDEAVIQIKSETGPRRTEETKPCPSLDRMLGAETAEAFKSLPSEGNGILTNKPNHILLTPEVFHIANGNKTVSAKKLAFDIISWLEADDEDEASLANTKRTEALGMETLLAMLWASENQGLTPITLEDVPDDVRLNGTLRRIKGKIGQGGPIVTPDRDPAERDRGRGADNLALASVVLALNRMHESQEADRSKKEAESSLFRTMGPPQRRLFTDLCTNDMMTDPMMTEFMKGLTRSKTPQKAVALLKAETRNWLGTFSEGGCHRFLSNGFLSLDSNKSNPGGFTVFMFFPKALDVSGKAFDGDSATMQDYFGMGVDEATIAYYTKQGYFAPENPYDLHIQLKTMRDMLELLTCKDSIVAKGINYILEPNRWDNITIQLHERFNTEPNFGAKFCYSIDKPIQMLLDKMTKWTNFATEGTPNYLTGKARELMEAVEEGLDLRVMLPRVLLNQKGSATGKDPKTGSSGDKRSSPTSPSNVDPNKPTSKKKRKTATAPTKTAASPGEAPIADAKAAATRTPSASHTNPSVRSSWRPPNGSTDYLSYFPGRMPGLLDWPRFADARLTKLNRKAAPVQLCVRYQAVGKCSMGCALAHVSFDDMKKEEQDTIDRLFREVYATAPANP